MGQLSYLGVLAFCVVGTVWLEVVLLTRVFARWRRLLAAVLPVAALFICWDVYAISEGHWTFDPARISGVMLPGGLPLDEVLFFLIIPTAAVLTLEAVRSARRWQVGDEPAEEIVGGTRIGER
ncbi:MAG: hypothetical protein QG671_3821 [Actinomycetota bacterium]|jgi:lycopene cyclase domain-containing protein|nr:hypothetical protein [Actinomycetota bacterium]